MNDEPTIQEFTEDDSPTQEVPQKAEGTIQVVEEPKGIQLTDEQQGAVNSILQWLDSPSSPQEFKLGGYAGTGKTTVIKALIAALHAKREGRRFVSVCAFTGKAVNVLQRKGLSAQTMHSLMYDVEQDPVTKQISFHKKFRLASRTDLIIVDEASMLSTDLYNDVKSFGTKLLFVGDPGQLEPVGDNPDLMAQPDLVLSKIHRQAEKSPIINFANQIRLGMIQRPQLQDGDELIIRTKQGMTIPEIISSDVSQVICAKNKTRTDVNKRFRLALNKPYDDLQADDKLIVLRNNQSYGVFNGMILFVDEVLPVPSGWESIFWLVNAHDEIDRPFYKLRIWCRPFVEELPKEFDIPRFEKAPLVYADFGYCITCHKSQGSEWDHVLVWDEWMPPKVWDMKRWRYTAITRAAKKLTYCI